MPTFLLNLRLCSEPYAILATVSIVDPIIIGYRTLVRRFADMTSVIEALEAAHIHRDRFKQLIDDINEESMTSIEINLNEGQNLSMIQTDTTE